MLGFVKSAFRVLFVFLLWLILIGSAIGGGITGAGMGWGDTQVGYAIIGAILGLLVGFIVVVLWGGLVATILNTDEKVEYIASQLKRYGGNIAAYNIAGPAPAVRELLLKKCSNCKKEVNDGYTACPYCGSGSFE